MLTVKELVGNENRVRFVKYFDGNLWYEVMENLSKTPGVIVGATGFVFPVPISDIGNATFLAEDKAILFMRYIRQHVKMLEEAKKQ